MQGKLSTLLTAVICVSCFLFMDCKSTPQGPHPERGRNEGYTLLHSLAAENSNLGKILVLKHADSRVVAEVKAIAEVYKDAKQQLDSFKAHDSSLNFQISDLPEIEQKTRNAIDKTYTKKLLFSVGRKFEVELLQSQIRSLDYAAHLARTIAGEEENKTRKVYLLQFAKQCDQHHRTIIDLLTNF
jgi:hypothetical protein